MVKKRITDIVTSDDTKSKRWRSLFGAARMAYAECEFRQAESLLARAMLIAPELPESTFAENTTEIGSAVVLLAEKRTKEAIKRLKKCVHDLTGHSDRKHQELLAVALRFYAHALIESGDEQEAEKELTRSVEILKGIGEDARVQYAYALADLGGLYVRQGRYVKAQNDILKAMKIVSEELGTEAAEYTRTDMIYQLTLPMTEPTRMEFASDAIERMQYQFGAKHPTIVRALERYMMVLSERGDKEKINEAVERFGLSAAAKKV